MMNIEPDHWAWQRNRPDHHGGATRAYMQDLEDDALPRGPNASPKSCQLCGPAAVEYDSASPDSTTWYLSSSTESSPDLLNGNSINKSLRIVTSDNRFNMTGK